MFPFAADQVAASTDEDTDESGPIGLLLFFIIGQRKRYLAWVHPRTDSRNDWATRLDGSCRMRLRCCHIWSSTSVVMRRWCGYLGWMYMRWKSLGPVLSVTRGMDVLVFLIIPDRPYHREVSRYYVPATFPSYAQPYPRGSPFGEFVVL